MNSSLVEDNMHVHEVLRAVTRSSLSPPLRLLIMAMCADATRINFTTGVYTGSLADLATATGYSDSSIRRHWRALKASGWVDVIERSGMSSVITLTPLTPGQDEPGSKMTPPVKMTPGTTGQDDPHPPVILTPPYKNIQEDQKNEEEDAREVRACTEGVSEHDAMVDASPSTCRDDVQETQPIREEVSAQDLDEYGRPADREFRVRELMRVAWRAMGDTGALRQLASVHRIERGDEDALKRRLAAPLRTIAASADRRIWSRADLEFYLFERVAALDARGVEPSRWMAMLSSRADMDTYEQEHIDPVDGAEMDAGALDGHNTTHDTSSVKEPYRGYYVPPVLSEEEKALQAAQQVEYWQQINSLLAANEERERREQEERAALYAELERTLVIGGRVGGES